MSDFAFIGLFAAIVFAPCLLAFLSNGLADAADPSDHSLERGPMPQFSGSRPMQAMLPELALSEDFEIRRFPKGLAQKRLVVRDTDSALRLTITQVREAAIELVMQGGRAVVYDLALVAAAMVAAGETVGVAASKALEAARNAYAWLAWNTTGERSGGWAQAPPPIQLDLEPGLQPRWSEATQAA